MPRVSVRSRTLAGKGLSEKRASGEGRTRRAIVKLLKTEGAMDSAGLAARLRVTPMANAFDLTPLPDATWGLHLVDANIALGDLADLVRHQISLYERR